MLARAEDRLRAIDAGDRRASGAGFALVAGRRRIAKVRATRPLQHVPADGCHVAQLARCSEEQRLTHDRISLAQARVPRHVAHASERAESEAAARQLGDGGERRIASAEVVDVDEVRRSFDIELHEIDEIRPTGNESRRRRGAGVERGVDVASAHIFEVDHRVCPPPFEACARRTSCTAAAMPGYAPQRQMLPLIASRTSSSPGPTIRRAPRPPTWSVPTCSYRTENRRGW